MRSLAIDSNRKYIACTIRLQAGSCGDIGSIESTVVGAAVVVTITAGVATYEALASREAVDAVAIAKRERDELAARLEEAESGDRQKSELTEERTAGSANQTASTADKRPAQAPGLQDGSKFLRAHPEIRGALVEIYRSDLLREFDELFASLEMSAAEIEEFVRIKISGSRRILGRYELSVADPAPSVEEYRANLRSLLGDVGMQRLLEYERMRPARQLPVELARALYFTSTPLTADQGREMQRIAVEALSDPASPKDTSKQLLFLP